MSGTHAPDPDDTDANSLVGAGGARVFQGPQRDRTRRKGGGFDKGTSREGRVFHVGMVMRFRRFHRQGDTTHNRQMTFRL